MKHLFWIATIAAAVMDVTGLAAAELPTYEVKGFPITRHQMAVTGAAEIKEQSPTPTFALGGMPASPHQAAVLTPRPRMIGEAVVLTPRPRMIGEATAAKLNVLLTEGQ